MLPDRVSNPGPLTYESGALPIALRGPARCEVFHNFIFNCLIRAIGSHFIINLKTLHLGHKNIKTYNVNARAIFFTAIELI